MNTAEDVWHVDGKSQWMFIHNYGTLVRPVTEGLWRDNPEGLWSTFYYAGLAYSPDIFTLPRG